MKAYILTIGDEILVGQIVDTNSAWMAQQLNLRGAEVTGKRAVGDDQLAITDGLRDALALADVVLLTGGLGPTKDDITKKTLAGFFGVAMEFSQETYERIERIFQRLGRPATEAHRAQAFMPANALLLFNKMGTAPGMWFEWQGKVIVSMPGVPFEMRYLMEHEVMPRLEERFPGQAIAHRTLLTAGAGESQISERLSGFEDALPDHIRLAYLPNLGQVRLRLTGRGSDPELLNRQLDQQEEELRRQLGSLVYGEGDDNLEAVTGRLLREQGKKIGTAESCTGGLLAHRITSIAGASDYFTGSIIAYSNEIKQRLLKVRPETLEQYGAVSKETVEEMVAGALEALGVDIAVAVSGIAGPGGGTEEKPVGTIWMAVGSRGRMRTLKLQAAWDRHRNLDYASTQALNLVRRFLQEEAVSADGAMLGL